MTCHAPLNRSLTTLLLMTGSLALVTGTAFGQTDDTDRLPPLMDEAREIELALSAAPPRISTSATVLVLRRGGYVMVREGATGVTCLVDRQMAQAIEPMCLNPEASETILRIFLRRAELREAGMSSDAIDAEIDAALERGELRLPEKLAFSYMFSPGQDIYTDDGRYLGAYQPHVMIWSPFLTTEQAGLGERIEGDERRVDPYVFRSGQIDAAWNVIVPEFVGQAPS